VAFIAVSSASGEAIVDTASAPEPGWVAGPLAGLAPALTDAGFAIGLLSLVAGYLVVLHQADRLSRRWIWGAIVGAQAALLLAPPLLSSDVFGYIAYARLGAIHGLNPYVHAPVSAPGDPLLPLVYWQHQTSPYGPLFTASSFATAPLGPAGALWAFKAVACIAALASAALIQRLAAAQGRDGRRAVALVALNPVLLLYAVGGAHNDVVVMMLVTVALLGLTWPAPRAGGIALVAAVATKVTAAVLLPFAIAGHRARRRLLPVVVAAVALVAGVTAATFGTHVFDTVTSIATHREFVFDNSGPVLAGRLLGTGLTTGVRIGALAIAGTVFAIALWRTYKGADWISSCGWATLAVLVSTPAFAPWYLCWVLPLAAAGRSRRLRVATVGLTVATALLYVPVLGRPPAP
jgi:hypothetical protein